MTQFFVPPKHVRAPELLIPGRKPVGPVEVDWTHPLARGLVALECFNDFDPLNPREQSEGLPPGMTYVNNYTIRYT